MAGPRLLLSTAAFFARPLAATFELAAGCGFTGVEVMVTKDRASQSASVMRDLAAEHGLWIGAIHAPALLLTRSVWGKDPIGKIDTATRVAATAKVPLVVMHPPYRWQRAYRQWLLGSLPSVEERTGITVAMENMFPVHIGSRPLLLHANQDLDQLVGVPHLVLDTSHAAVAKHDLIEVRQLFGERLRHVHLSDNAGKGWDSHLPPGACALDLDGFVRDLAASGFDGTVSLEVDLRKRLGATAGLRSLLVDMCREFQSLLAET